MPLIKFSSKNSPGSAEDSQTIGVLLGYPEEIGYKQLLHSDMLIGCIVKATHEVKDGYEMLRITTNWFHYVLKVVFGSFAIEALERGL